MNKQNPIPDKAFLTFNSINDALEADEQEIVRRNLVEIDFLNEYNDYIQNLSQKWVEQIRNKPLDKLSIESFLNLYPINTPQGSALMSLSEAYLRISDKLSKTDLIADKIQSNVWRTNPEGTKFENFTTHTLSLIQKIFPAADKKKPNYLHALIQKSSAPFIRSSVKKILGHMSQQFILEAIIESAFDKAVNTPKSTFSFDMLGEGARTQKDADCYFQSYLHAIDHIGKKIKTTYPHHFVKVPSISIKLSALHPRYDPLQKERVLSELTHKVYLLVQKAHSLNVPLTIDAEEIERLYLSLAIFQTIFEKPEFKQWNDFGLVIQAYHKGANNILLWLKNLALKHNKKITVRLVKGAYWDTEIKISQQKGLKTFPVFTRKASTDLSYLTCANLLLKNTVCFYPQFASHNVHTIASIHALIHHHKRSLEISMGDLEFQRLHGMGSSVFDQLHQDFPDAITRIYAPVGGERELLSYLVRRLLENGANGSFLNQLFNEKIPIAQVIASPLHKIKSLATIPHPKIDLPSQIFKKTHKNSKGLDIKNWFNLDNLYAQMSLYQKKTWIAGPLIQRKINPSKTVITITNPANINDIVGHVTQANEDIVKLSLYETYDAFKRWGSSLVTERAKILEHFADNLEQNIPLLTSLLIREAGKTVQDAIDEIREAVDFCRYYAHQARTIMSTAPCLQGPAGELNELTYGPRGVFVCISPWNFPLAIFIGQIAAALVTGNCVIAKSASQTSIVAFEAIKIAHKSGIPKDVLNFMPTSSHIITQHLLLNPKIAGVVFTGSNKTATQINGILANKPGPIIPFIAETGGMNAMVVDSSALPEQVIDDVLTSGFKSAGQRCSALRILFIQKELFPLLTQAFADAINEIKVGNPWHADTDVGPIIDKTAKGKLETHLGYLRSINARLIGKAPLDPSISNGHFFAPQIWELQNPHDIKEEVFGPIIHIVPYNIGDFKETIETINAYGYGLTFGIHSRIDSRIDYVRKHAKVGNIYVNRNMIGAVVASQPFGGEGLSGTGPKAGGPNYLYRFLTERTFTKNITASGGNAALVCLEDDDTI